MNAGVSGLRRSGRKRAKPVTRTDLGYEPSDKEEEDSEPDVDSDGDGSDEAGGAESSYYAEEEKEEMGGEGPVSGVDMVRFERVITV